MNKQSHFSMRSSSRTIVLLCLSLITPISHAYDWEAKTNEALYHDMMNHATAFADREQGTRMGRVLKHFIKAEKKKFADNPYAWILDTYRVTRKLEKLCPPVHDDGSEAAATRRNLLRLVEFPIHEHDRIDPKSPTVAGNQDPGPEQREAFEQGRDWYRYDALEKAVRWLGKPAPKSGELSVFRVYNMGYIFRTSNRSFAIDLGREMPDRYCRALVEKLDAIFLTHPHDDHYYKPILQAMTEAGKSVFLPKDIIPDSQSEHKNIMWEDVMEPMEISGIKVRMLAGNQNTANPASMPCNIYHLMFDGWTITHSGDNQDYQRQIRLGELPCPDIAIFASWNNVKHNMNSIRKSPDFDESKVTCLTSHENEFWHRVQQRESWWEDFTRTDRYADKEYDYLPCIFMDNGESILMKK